MRRSALFLVALGVLAGCTSPFTPYPSYNLPEIRAVIAPAAYDSDDDNLTDGIQLTLRTAQPTTPLVGSDVIIERNGDSNVTVWRCRQRQPEFCLGNRGILSWDVGEDIFIRGLPGANRLNVVVKERFVYNASIRVDETRDTEVWGAVTARAYDSNGNGTTDGIEVVLIDSDKAPFRFDDVRVRVNGVDVPFYRDAGRSIEATGLWGRGSRVFFEPNVIGDNRVELFIHATRFDLGVHVVGE